MKQVRWFELLEQYKFTIHYISKKNNGRADALSKRPDYITTEKKSFMLLVEKKNGTFINITAQLNAIISINDKKTIK